MLDIQPFDGRRATDAEIDECHELRIAVYAVDYPDLPVQTRQETAAGLRTPTAQRGEDLRWQARLDGRLVGQATVGLPADGNEHIAGVHISVHPSYRRRGIGTTLMDTMTPVLWERGRKVMEGYYVTEGSTGDHFTRALGFSVVQTRVAQMLTFAEVDPQRWDVAVPDGYRLVRWIGHCPDDLVESYSRARHAIDDAPTGDSTYVTPGWSVARIRQLEAENREQGVEWRTVVAVDEQGEVAGLTEVERLPLSPDRLFQGDTAVLTAHRGHGLGLAMKADMLRRLTADNDGLDHVWTSTDATNTHMVAVNEKLGFETVRRSNVVSRELEH
jgi:mycothiol synthase